MAHNHKMAIISHTPEMSRLLVMCMSPLTCVQTEVWTKQTHRVKVADRKYRDQTPEEFTELTQSMEHRCCVS